MLTRSQASLMLELQDQMNAKVNPQWLTAGYPYLRASVIEGAEAMEHHGWKWWKAQEKDLPQLQMELIDIWHFTLSHLILEQGGDLARAADGIMADAAAPAATVVFDGKEYGIASLDLLAKIELLIGLSAARRVSLALFGALMADCGLDWAELFRQYVGKNVLNFFRQDNGYKQGTYRKIWAGREDNEHLVELMAQIDATASDYRDRLYAGLRERYEGTRED